MHHRLLSRIFVAASWAAPIACAVAAQATDRPNILVILADDLGYGSVNAYGADPALVRTPNIDRLAREGRRFTDANTTSSVCSPTRYALLTGRYAWRTSLKSGVLSHVALHIETTRPTLASLLKKHGYQTAAIGKWHLGYGAAPQIDYTAPLKPGPLEIGFDYHFGVPHNHGDIAGAYVENHGVWGLSSTELMPIEKEQFYGKSFLGLDAPQRDDEEVMATLTDKALRWITGRDPAKPFFLYFNPVAVHEPVTPSKRTAGSSAAGPYGDWIHELDRSVGRLLDALEQQGLAKDTLVLFTSDNGGVVSRGGATGAHTGKAMDAGLKICGDWRGGKQSVYEGGCRVPYLVRWPGKVPAGTVSAETISLVDTFATLASLLNEKMPPNTIAAEDSYNVLPAWLGEKTAAALRPHLITHGGDGTFAIRAGRWKWIEGRPAPADTANDGAKPPAKEPSPQLYDLSADPAEKNDLGAQHPEIVQRLSALLQRVKRTAQPAPAAGRLRPHPANPRYFTDGSGRADLTGSHTWSNLQDMGPGDPPPAFDFDAYLDFLERHHHNFIRLWRWESTAWDTRNHKNSEQPALNATAPHPWKRTGPGQAPDGRPKFNLEEFEPAFFDRLRARVRAAGERGIYVSVMLFEGSGLQPKSGRWDAHPFHPANNVNGIDGDTNGDGHGAETHTLSVPAVTALQERYVRAVLDTLNDLDNVLYEISNESIIHSAEWQYHLIRYIKQYEKGKPKQHPVGMTSQYSEDAEERRPLNRALFDSPADWISPNRWTAEPYDYQTEPPPADGTRVMVNDTDHLWGVGGNPAWAWKSFCRGLNPIFMDPLDNRVLGRGSPDRWDELRQSLGHTRRLAERVELAAMTPREDLATTSYCLAEPGVAYIVYLPQGGEVTVDLSAAAGSLHVEWMHPVEGATTPGPPVAGGGQRGFTSPLRGDAVLYLARVAP